MKKLIVMFLAVMLLGSGVIYAGSLDRDEVSKEAQWIVHIDNDQLGKSVIGNLIRKNLEETGEIAEMEELAEMLSFDSFDDVNDITVYGQSAEKDEFIVIVEGSFDKEALLAFVPEVMQHEVIQYGQNELHSWQGKEQVNEAYVGIKYDGEIELEARQGEAQINVQDVNKAIYGCFFSDELVVLSGGLDTLKSAIDVLNGTAENAQVSDAANSNDNESIFFRVFVKDVGEIAGDEPKAAILKQTDTLELVIGESDGLFFLNVDLVTESEGTAATIETMLNGILAFAAVAADEEPQVAELASKVTVLTIGNSVQIRFESEPESVVELLKTGEWNLDIGTPPPPPPPSEQLN